MYDANTPYDQGIVNRRRVLGDAWVDKSLTGLNMSVAAAVLREKGLLPIKETP